MKLLRSPFWSVLSIVTVALLMITKLEKQDLPSWFTIATNGALIVSVLIILFWLVSVLIHNRKQPTQKVSWHGFYPVEFREEDEGMRWLTYQACRRAYMFFYVSLPIALIVLFLFPESRSLPILLIASLAISQYIIYWSVIRKADVEEEEL